MADDDDAEKNDGMGDDGAETEKSDDEKTE
jgi:hypothetical protein